MDSPESQSLGCRRPRKAKYSMKFIVVTNHKGGVGKTTVAIHLAVGLALRGYRVGMADTDSQGHLALALGLAQENGLYQIMTNYETLLSEVLRTPDPARLMPPGWSVIPELVILPGAKATAAIPSDNPSPFRFRHVLEDMAEMLQLDYIVVDTGPSNSMFDGSVNFAADYFLYVTECAMLSFDGLKKSISELEKMNAENARYRQHEAKILGIVPNKGLFNTRNQRDNIALLSEAFPGVIWSPITRRTIWESAMDNQQTVFSYMPDGQESRDAWRLIEQFEERLNHG